MFGQMCLDTMLLVIIQVANCNTGPGGQLKVAIIIELDFYVILLTFFPSNELQKDILQVMEGYSRF